ncbi:DUF4283 domain protein [Medicago truncatula]|uniref:DUF4283 domain protein n=1 Tax=Medicago truncatula TaxID=3880 RepID=A0A072U949_MEDTR|nr:DUF4283 domain protein [Medicago truncatula]
MNLVVYSWDLLLFLSVFSKDLNPMSTTLMWLYLGLYGLQSILLIMNIFILLVKIWLSLTFVCSETYKNETHLLVFIHCFMKSSLLFFTYILFLTFISIKKRENLNINGDNGAASHRPNLTQAELLDLCLVGRVVVNKPVHLATLEARLGPIWDPMYQMSLIPMEDNKFMVQLYSKADLARILDRSPWLLDNNMIILKKVVVGENPLTMSMNTTEIWAQIHKLPFGFMGDKVGALVGSHIGKMIKFDEENNYGPWWRFMRVRVEIAVEAPLQQEFIIEREEGENIRLVFRYEKLGKQ